MDHTHVPDRTLLKHIGLGDASALRALHARYAKSVYALAMTRLRSPQDAHHIVADTFARAWKNTTDLDEGRFAVITWLLDIARCLCQDLLRRRGNLHERDDTEHEDCDGRTPVLHEAEQLMVARSQLRALEHCRLALSSAQQEALQLAVVEGLSLAQVSALTRVSVCTVKLRVFHARRQLAHAMNAYQTPVSSTDTPSSRALVLYKALA
jgi:RNA polymerase sigma-70 factor, ECF subfamily